jgi:predicted SprT family Zn-dependent metalloprotease
MDACIDGHLIPSRKNATDVRSAVTAICHGLPLKSAAAPSKAKARAIISRNAYTALFPVGSSSGNNNLRRIGVYIYIIPKMAWNVKYIITLFNEELFCGCRLPDLLVTLQRRAKTRGYFAAERFHGRVDKDTVTHELALNPDVFTEQSDELILSTLVHEMTHAWQQTHGKVPRRGYHDKQWAAKMKEIGLWPSSTGDLNGKETGQNVSHYIIPDGAYASAYKKLAATGFRVNWESQPEADRRKRQVGRASKTKYTCRVCRANAWARPRSKLICGDCYLADQEITMMLATDTEEDAPCTRQP